MTPVPASKKFWVFDGSVEQYPSVLVGGSVHMSRACTDCHGGTEGEIARLTAHTPDFDKFSPASNTSCEGCHTKIATSAAEGLHTTLGGYEHILAMRGFDFNDATSRARFDAQCTKCHTADPAVPDAEGYTNCGQCHVSVPDTAGGGLLAGHAFQGTPSMDNNCTACHGSRVKDEFYGLNNEILGRNKAAYDADSPWKDPAFALVGDVHKTEHGFNCMDCHGANEMHGAGHPEAGLGDRYHVSTAPGCDSTGCHTDVVDINSYHTSAHIAQMDCQICHAQPYKNCFACHTDVTDTDLAFYKINEADPTLAARKAASSDPDSVYPDALMTLRVGRNPRFGEEGQKFYALLRHVPVDRDTFAYTGANESPATLIPGLTNLPLWKRATPHNIVRVAPIATSCQNCHGSTDYRPFWLGDAVDDAEGWVAAASEADEDEANESVLQEGPLPTSSPP